MSSRLNLAGLSCVPTNLAVMVKPNVEATKKLLAELLAEPEPSPYEDLEPDYEYMPAP